MSDLIERLRRLGNDLNKGYKDRRRKTCELLREAADRIEELESALQPFAKAHKSMSAPNQIIDPYEHITLHDLRMAAEALGDR